MTLPGGTPDLHSASTNLHQRYKTCLYWTVHKHSRSDDLLRVRPDGPTGSRFQPSPPAARLPSHHWRRLPPSIPDDRAVTESSSSASRGSGPALCTCGSKSASPPTLSERVSPSVRTCQKAPPGGRVFCWHTDIYSRAVPVITLQAKHVRHVPFTLLGELQACSSLRLKPLSKRKINTLPVKQTFTCIFFLIT